MTHIAIEFKDAGKTYKLPRGGGFFEALKPLNLSISRGECFGLLGQNGAGKTTTISLLAGINQITSGDIFIEGLSVRRNAKETKRMLGVVQQELVADSFFNLPTMLSIQSKLSGFVPDLEWIDFLLEKLLLKDHTAKTTRELSGGMKRRMMIARALVHKPKILVLDEPTAGVDIELRHSMWNFISELHQYGMTIILTTHYLEEAEQFCSRIAIMKNGEVVTLKKNKELLALGGKHKICCLGNISNQDEWSQSHEKYLHENNIDFELVKSDLTGPQSVKIFLPYEQGNMLSFSENSQLLSKIAKNINLNIYEVFTESPSLEDVFIKVNKGLIK